MHDRKQGLGRDLDPALMPTAGNVLFRVAVTVPLVEHCDAAVLQAVAGLLVSDVAHAPREGVLARFRGTIAVTMVAWSPCPPFDVSLRRGTRNV